MRHEAMIVEHVSNSILASATPAPSSTYGPYSFGTVTITCLLTGGISKTDIRRFLYWAADHLGYSELRGVVAAPPSAELEPIREGEEAQTDEQDMGMTYDVSHLACSLGFLADLD